MRDYVEKQLEHTRNVAHLELTLYVSSRRRHRATEHEFGFHTVSAVFLN